MTRRTTIFRLVCAIIGLGLMAPSSGRGDDWPGWRGADRNGVVQGFTAPKSWPDELKKVWQVEVGIGHSSPLLVGEKIYQFSRFQDEESLACLDLSGKLLWRKGYAAPYKVHVAAQGHGKGPKSTPLAAGGKIYTFGIGGVLTCWSADSGEVVWKREFAKDYKKTSPLYGASASPLLSGKNLVLHVGGHDSGAFSAFDALTGEPRWKWEQDGPGYSSPIATTLAGVPQLVTQSQKFVIGVSPEGKLLWSVPYTTDYDQNSVSPVVVGDLVIVSGVQRGITAYRIAKSGESLAAKEAWHADEVSLYMSTPIVVGKLLYGFSHYKSGQVFCLDPTSGKVKWSGPPRQGENAALLVAGNLLVALTTEPKLVFFTAGGEKYVEQARYPASDTPVWAHPVLRGKRILVKDANALILWSLEEK